MNGRLMRSATWPLLAAGGIGLGAWVAWSTHRGAPRDPRIAALMLAITCGGMAVLLMAVQAARRSRVRREWRDAAGRARSQRGPATAGGEDVSGLREEVASLRGQIAGVKATADAAAGIVARACRLEGAPVPAALQPAEVTEPLPAVRLACRNGRQVSLGRAGAVVACLALIGADGAAQELRHGGVALPLGALTAQYLRGGEDRLLFLRCEAGRRRCWRASIGTFAEGAGGVGAAGGLQLLGRDADYRGHPGERLSWCRNTRVAARADILVARRDLPPAAVGDAGALAGLPD
jgi:hypothetical protein